MKTSQCSPSEEKHKIQRSSEDGTRPQWAGEESTHAAAPCPTARRTERGETPWPCSGRIKREEMLLWNWSAAPLAPWASRFTKPCQSAILSWTLLSLISI